MGLHSRNEEIESNESDENYIMSNGEIIIGIESNKPPMTYYDDNGILTGFDTEFAEGVFSKFSIDVIFKEIKWDMKEEELNSKNIDCVWNSLTLTEARREIFEFTLPYINNKQVVVIRRSDASKYPDAKSLSGAKMTAGLATTGEEALLGDPYLSQSDYTASSSQNEAVMMLKNGLYDAIVIDYTLAKGYIFNDKSDLMVIDGISLQEEQYAVGFRHGSDMAKKVNDVFLGMILDGSLNILANKYNLYDLYSPLIITDSDYILENGKMIIGYQGNVPPMSYYDDKKDLIGFDIEFSKAICQELGIQAEFKVIIWDDKEVDLLHRNIDCIWNALTVTEARRNNIKFSRVYMSNTQVVVIRKADASIYTDLQSLSKATFSAAIGSIGENAIKEDIYLSHSNYIGSSSMDEALNRLYGEEVDAIIIDYTLAIGSISNDFSNLMVVDGINFGEEVYAVGFRVGSDMTIKVNKLINKMINDGSLELLAKKYGLIDLYTPAAIYDGESELDYIMFKGEIIIGIQDNIPPMSYNNKYGKLTGFNIEFAKEVCSRLGIDAVFKIIDWNKKETELNNKNIDCIWNSLTITEENREKIQFSHGYLINKQVVVIRKSDALSRSKISAGLGTIGEELLKTDSYLSQAKYTASNSQNEAILSLKNGTFDAIVIDYVLAKGSIDNGNDDLMIIEGINLQENHYRIGFRVGSDMIKKINNVILDMFMDETLVSIVKEYDIVDLIAPLRTSDAGYIIENGKMVIGYDGDLVPMSYNDNNGQLVGFDVEFAKDVCRRLGIEAEFKVIDWSQKEMELKNRNIDCIWSGLSVTDGRRENMKFSRVYMHNKQVVMIKKSDASKYTNLESLSNAKISAKFGSTGEQALKSDKNLLRAEYVSSDSQNEAILALKKGDFNAIVIDYSTAVGTIANGNADLMILKELTTGDETFAIGFRLNSDMTTKINKLINDMINDGTLETIAKKYNLFDLYSLAIKNNGNSDYDYIMSKGELIIGIGIEGAPMVYYNEYNELTGFDIEFAKAVCSLLGIDAIFKNIEWDKKETELSYKNIDCIWNSLTVTEERRKIFKFSDIYLSNRQVVVIRSSDASIYTDTEIIGSISEDVIKEEPYLSKAKYIASPTQDKAVTGLKNGDWDAIITDFSLAKGIINNNNYELMVISGIHLQEEQYAVGFRVNSDLTEKVNEMIMDMILDDSLTTLAEKYDLNDLFEPVKMTDAGYIMGKGKMVIGFDGTLAPMSYYDNNGQLAGFDIDLAKAVCKELGISSEFKLVDWNNKEVDLKKRTIDCIWSGLSVTEKRREIIKFSRVYMNNKQIIVIRKSNVLKYNDLESLYEANISSKIGSLGEFAVMTYFPNANYKSYSSLDDMFTTLEKGNIDAVVIDYTMAIDKLNNGGFSGLMIIENIELMNDQYAVGFRHGSDMTRKVNEIIKKMMTDGTVNEIAKKYNLLSLYTIEKKTSNSTVVIFMTMILYFALVLAI
ncbi:hypothetical protein PIROE2DRAFT_15531 [Piromyces sp. E2]|nr:hypothetical protein PIROE2DRAFT_15531 [Piromyces sp. E2]|eukprot:OUM59044.1 hypothetical protein PIROE2DRAFT_15531 [Piromyces sp. E2]